MSDVVLSARNVTMQFGGLKAVSGLNLEIPKGSIFGLIGPNGAGKTTVFNVLTGIYQPTMGDVHFEQHKLAGKRPFEVTHLGMARTFQNIRLFKDLSVLDNVKIAIDANAQANDASLRSSLVSSVLHTAAFRAREQRIAERALDLLEIFKLRERAHLLARELPYGDQRRLEIARAIGTDARLLLLDEPAAGMNPREKIALMETLRFIRERFHVTILLIEHDMKLVMNVCERIAVLDFGVKISEGSPVQVQNDARVIEAYLGKEAVAHG